MRGQQRNYNFGHANHGETSASPENKGGEHPFNRGKNKLGGVDENDPLEEGESSGLWQPLTGWVVTGHEENLPPAEELK